MRRRRRGGGSLLELNHQIYSEEVARVLHSENGKKRAAAKEQGDDEWINCPRD